MALVYPSKRFPAPPPIGTTRKSLLHYVIKGDPRTKKNSQRIFYKGLPCRLCHKGATPFIMPSKAYEEYEQRALWQLTPKPSAPIQRPVTVRCLFYMKTKRAVDLNNLLEAACDILVAGRVLADDNSDIVVSHDGSRVLHDKQNPRVEIYIEYADTTKKGDE